MLKYIEKTTDKNVVNRDIEAIQKLVTQVKRKKEVNISYMKSWEIENMIRKESYAEGHNDGYGKGHDDGYGEGHDDGYGEGHSDGCDKGQDRVNQLNMKLSEAGRSADIIKAAGDKAYQESLFVEFNL